MRVLLVLFVLASSLLLVSAEPTSLCPSLPVQLELHPSSTQPNKFQLIFNAIDPNTPIQPEFVDIHYRVNNEESINLRVLTQTGLAGDSIPMKQAQVDGIELRPGDALRAYATYAAKGYACDTPVHTFSAPELDMDPTMLRINQIDDISMLQSLRRRAGVRMTPHADQFVVQQMITTPDVEPTTQGVCPSIAFDQDVLKVAGLEDTYVLVFENRNPNKQLAFVDLHVSTNAATHSPEWENLRLATDMQLTNAHKVMQPGVVVHPTETLHWYWSYRTLAHDGTPIDCTTPISVVTPQQVTHAVSIAQLQALGKM